MAAVDFDGYDLDPAIYDEMFLPDGAPREHCRQLHETLTQLSAEELGSIQERVTRSFSNEGITFTVYGDDEADERIIPIDCLRGTWVAICGTDLVRTTAPADGSPGGPPDSRGLLRVEPHLRQHGPAASHGQPGDGQ